MLIVYPWVCKGLVYFGTNQQLSNLARYNLSLTCTETLTLWLNFLASTKVDMVMIYVYFYVIQRSCWINL